MPEKTFAVATPTDFGLVISVVLDQAATITEQAAIITLTGDLGAGKTTFTQQLAIHLGITETVVSPTFGIMKGYELTDHPHFDQLIHIDAYRIEDISEVGPLRFEELFKTPRTLICLEWPENITGVLPTEKVAVEIEIGEGKERRVIVR
jgi:tRNA threonylcarbamoyladenosine biosynthesis protein TsaE